YSDYRNTAAQNNLTKLYDAQDNFISQTNTLLQQHRRLNIYEAKVDYTQPLKNNGHLDAGWKSSYVKSDNKNIYYDQTGGMDVIDSTQSDYSLNTENINAAYININKSYAKLKVQGGLRAEQTVTKGTQLFTGQSIEQNYLQLFPSLFFDYKADDQNGFNLKLGRRIDRAAYSEMIPFRRAQTPTLFFQGNPNLMPQLSWHGEFTWSYQSAFFVTFNYDIYHNYIRTLPFLDANKVTITRRPINVQGAHSWEADFTYSKKIVNWWSTDNTLSVYQNAFNGTANGFSLDNSGIPSVYLTTTNNFVLGKKTSAECDFEYNSKRQFVTSRFGAYSILSFGLKQLIWDDRGSITVNAHNVLQSEGHNAIDRNAGLYQYSEWHFYTRSISVSFTYRFGNGKVTKAHAPGASEEQGRAGG
ncbi:MAG TPA: outer membrane beta-barrel family protein, partial [Mucilaginibacter sp.]